MCLWCHVFRFAALQVVAKTPRVVGCMSMPIPRWSASELFIICPKRPRLQGPRQGTARLHAHSPHSDMAMGAASILLMMVSLEALLLAAAAAAGGTIRLPSDVGGERA